MNPHIINSFHDNNLKHASLNNIDTHKLWVTLLNNETIKESCINNSLFRPLSAHTLPPASPEATQLRAEHIITILIQTSGAHYRRLWPLPANHTYMTGLYCASLPPYLHLDCIDTVDDNNCNHLGITTSFANVKDDKIWFGIW